MKALAGIIDFLGTAATVRARSRIVGRLALAASTFVLVACGGPTHTEASTVTVTQPVPVQPTAAGTAGGSHETRTRAQETIIDDYGSPQGAIDHDGRYVLITDIMPGRYRNAGGTMCYWARLRSLDTKDIIDSRRSDVPQEIDLHDDDTAFLTQNCGIWQQVHVSSQWDF